MRVMVILVSLRSQDWSSLLSDGTVWLANVRRWALRPAQVCVSGGGGGCFYGHISIFIFIKLQGANALVFRFSI